MMYALATISRKEKGELRRNIPFMCTIFVRTLSYSETVKKKVTGVTNGNTDISLSADNCRIFAGERFRG